MTVFHFQGEPQRCLYCLDPLTALLVDERVVRCKTCGIRYSIDLLAAAGTEAILGKPDRYHIERIPATTSTDEPSVLITDLDAARSVLAARGDE